MFLLVFPSLAAARLTWRCHQDTFVVGCEFSDKIIYHDTFAGNPDSQDAVYNTKYGIYQPHCGLDNVMLSWGHDEVSVSVRLFMFRAGSETTAKSVPVQRLKGPKQSSL